jgi:hypothetical protein
VLEILSHVLSHASCFHQNHSMSQSCHHPSAAADVSSAAAGFQDAHCPLTPEMMPSAWRALTKVCGKMVDDIFTPVAYLDNPGSDTQVGGAGGRGVEGVYRRRCYGEEHTGGGRDKGVWALQGAVLLQVMSINKPRHSTTSRGWGVGAGAGGCIRRSCYCKVCKQLSLHAMLNLLSSHSSPPPPWSGTPTPPPPPGVGPRVP